MKGFGYLCFYRGIKIIVKEKCKMIITCVVLFLGVLVLVPTVASVESNYKFLVSVKTSELDCDSIEFIPIEATSHEDYGKKVVNRKINHFKILKNMADRTYDENEDSIEENLSAWKNDSNFTIFLDELEGIRHELDKIYKSESISLGKVVNMGRKLVTISLLDFFKKCTTTAATGSATDPENQIYLHQNLDSAKELRIYFDIITKKCYIAKIDEKYNYAFWQVPILNEFVFLNEKGLGFGGNALTLDTTNNSINTSENLTAIPSHWLARRTMMECERVNDPSGENINDVKELWRFSVRASGADKTWPHGWNNQNNIWCDRFGGILTIEQMNDFFDAKTENPIWPDNPDILWHTNHHIWLNPNQTGSINVSDEKTSSGPRADRAYELLNDSYENLNFDKFVRIAKDHGGGLNKDKEDENDICRDRTMYSWIIQPDVERVSWTLGKPCKEDFITFSFDDIFNAEETDEIILSSLTPCPSGYYYQSGSIPCLLNQLENYDYLLDDYEGDNNYSINLTICALISDSLADNKEQSNHDYTISRTNEISDIFNDTYSYITLVADGIVNASLGNDDPDNKSWTTIQKAVDNMTNLDILIVENGTYNEDVVLNKSIIIFGEDEETTIIDGSITMNNPHDYELLQETDQIANVNMTDLGLLMHFNNHSIIGENYSNSTNIYDYSPPNNNGTNNNASFTTSTIKGEGAFIFNGTNNSIHLPSIPALTGENVTVSSWIYWKKGTGNKDTILSQSNETLGYCLYVNSSTNIPKFRLDTTVVASSQNISEGWHNIVGTHNSTTLKIYVDGVQKGSTSKSGSGADRNTFIGFDNISSYYNGTIDEIAVWNRTLSGDEIFHIYDQHFGVVIDGFTIKNSNIGIIPVNHTDITNCILQNHTTGILLENISDIKIQCNFSECTTSLKINNNNPDEFNKIRVMDSFFDNNTEGIIIDNTTNIDIYRVNLNNSNTPLEITNSNFTKININNTFSTGNYSPDTPQITGPSLGDINTSYNYNYCTNDSNGDCIFYYFDWGDGNNTGWFGPHDSGISNYKSHSWSEQGGYYVKVKAKDIFYNETDWSNIILFKTETLPPLINMVNDTPDTVGFGYNVTITTNVTENTTGNYSGIKTVKVNISYPDDSYVNISMNDIGNDTYEYVFTDTWTVGQYDYSIWATDNAYNSVTSSGHSFNISVDATISICTINSSYGSNDTINLTDPPGSSYLIGYELLDDGDVLHIWNKLDNYYFNTSSGIQLTNHYNEYWSHNVLMLGYYNNDQWNLIYRTDELSGFNKEIESDNETYVNATLWKDLSYAGYDFRLAIRYYLGVDDNELTVIPYIKNIDNEDIPYILGFAWEIKDIQIDMTEENDYINIDGASYYLNDTGLDETYTNLNTSSFYIKEDTDDNKSESLYLRWDENLNYKVQVKSRDGQYNAPVTLGIKIGTLSVGQEKQTKLFWYDACKTTYHFTSYDTMVAWSSNPANMVDGNTSNYASTTTNMDIETCNGNSCLGSDLGAISKVEIRCFGKYSGSDLPQVHDICLIPAVGGKYTFTPGTTGSWSNWYDITNNPSAPNPWVWTDVQYLIVDVESSIVGAYTLYCSEIEIQVTYNAYPGMSNFYPANGATGVPITPVLNITVSDLDGETMNITWLSNSSGSWQSFGTNSSVSNGTYHQTFSNATVNGQWWYWKVNVSDGTNYKVSDVFSFFTGYQSKIENTGSTNFTGYLLMQIEYYNSTSSTWILEQEVVNETTPRTINVGSELGLDTIFNPNNVSTSSFTNGNGTYRVYAAFRDPDGDVLVCDDESLLEDSYQFTVTSS